MQNIKIKLPPKEALLFSLLKRNEGKAVSKDELFKVIWQNSDEVTDWSLNALIYRLRKNPTFSSSGYTIESQKKIGYYLLKL